MGWFTDILDELVLSVTSSAVLAAVALSLTVAMVCLAVGLVFGRVTRFISDRDAIAVELALGTLIVAATWATLRSTGQSSFTIVAVGFVAAFVSGLWRRRAPQTRVDASSTPSGQVPDPGRRRGLVLGLIAGGAFLACMGLLYASTIEQRPRDGVQPVEFADHAYYALLGRELSVTGTESMYGPSGFDDIPDLPKQNSYHWGEIWLASATISWFDLEPLLARNVVVMPVVLLASAALAGVTARRLARATSTRAFERHTRSPMGEERSGAVRDRRKEQTCEKAECGVTQIDRTNSRGGLLAWGLGGSADSSHRSPPVRHEPRLMILGPQAR